MFRAVISEDLLGSSVGNRGKISNSSIDLGYPGLLNHGLHVRVEIKEFWSLII